MFIRHETLERNAFLFVILTVLVIAIGGLVEVIPLFTIETTVEHVTGVRPYTPLESRGRDIYVREGCYLCHSQMILALRDEVERYGHIRLRRRACTIIRSSGVRSGSVRIWLGLAANTPTTGIMRILPTRRVWCRNR